MYFCLPSTHKIAIFKNDMVVLDLDNNRFRVIEFESREELNDLFDSDRRFFNKKSKVFIEKIIGSSLIESNIPEIIDEILSPEGFFEQRWMKPLVDVENTSFTGKVVAFLFLQVSSITIKFSNFNGLRKLLMWHRNMKQKHAIRRNVSQHIRSLNSVFQFDWSYNQCLSYSATLCQSLIRSGYEVKLVVGVRTRPFLAHAWVENANGDILADDDLHLRNKMSIILKL